MARTESKMIALGTKAPEFKLQDTDGTWVSLNDLNKSQGYLIMFICNHCPYVKHISRELSQITTEYLKKGVTAIGINSNDVKNYPDDRPELMSVEKEKQKYSFPYLFDETQNVAKAYDAACTPDFYLFNSQKELVYRGQFDESRPNSGIPVTGKDLKLAMDSLLKGEEIFSDQKPSLGCNIKWKP